MYQWSCMLSLLIYSSVAVFVIVGGQPENPETDGDWLINTVATLVAKVAILEAKVAKLSANCLPDSKYHY